jgi:hypothetical protein
MVRKEIKEKKRYKGNPTCLLNGETLPKLVFYLFPFSLSQAPKKKD